MVELIAGEEMRRDPGTLEFSLWLRDEVLNLPHDSTAQFPASFDRSVWARPEDLDELPAQSASQTQHEEKNILELAPIKSRRNIDDQPLISKDWRIAATLVTFRGSISQALKRVSEQEPAAALWAMPQGWTRVGYDVLDSGLAISGLLNCGSASVELARRILGKYSIKLNRFYLWPSSEVAAEYAAELDKLVPDHAPFEVVGLYVYENISKAEASV